MKEKSDANSRRAFLGAGLIVGGALYSDPAAAIANVGGRTFGGVRPDTSVFKGNTPISKLVDNLPKNLSTLTLAELDGLAALNEADLVKLNSKYSLQIGDLQTLLTTIEGQYGTGSVLTSQGSGIYAIACCCCRNVTFQLGGGA
jgi:hypothetical protein